MSCVWERRKAGVDTTSYGRRSVRSWFVVPSRARPYLSWLIAPSSCISIDSVQSPTILQGPQATEVKSIGRTLDRWFSDDSPYSVLVC